MSYGSEVNNCPYCGSAIEKNQEFCHNCGASLDDPDTTYQSSTTHSTETYTSTPQQTQYGYTEYPRQTATYVPPRRSTDDSSGVIALIFGILACTGILPCIGSIVAIVVGSNAKNNGSQTGQIGFILGWISCCLPILGLFLAFMFI